MLFYYKKEEPVFFSFFGLVSVQRVGFIFSDNYLDTQKCSFRHENQIPRLSETRFDSLRESEGGVSKPNPKGLLDKFLTIKKLEKSSIVRDTKSENFVERKVASSNLKGLFDDFSNQQNLIKFRHCAIVGDKAAENFVERYRTSHHNNILGTPKKISCQERRKRERGDFFEKV